MKADGQLTKLERLGDALNFAKAIGEVGFDETAKFRAILVKWRRTLRSEKERRTVERLEKESEEKIRLGGHTESEMSKCGRRLTGT
jgi:hypothetical protein